MASQYLPALRNVVKILDILADRTATTVDDALVAVLQKAIENPVVLEVIEAIIRGIQENPGTSPARIYSSLSPSLRDEAELACGKIGDGKLVDLLVKVGPLLVKILPLILAL